MTVSVGFRGESLRPFQGFVSSQEVNGARKARRRHDLDLAAETLEMTPERLSAEVA